MMDRLPLAPALSFTMHEWFLLFVYFSSHLLFVFSLKRSFHRPHYPHILKSYLLGLTLLVAYSVKVFLILFQ